MNRLNTTKPRLSSVSIWTRVAKIFEAGHANRNILFDLTLRVWTVMNFPCGIFPIHEFQLDTLR
jgi:hypothetical protein